MWYRNYTPRNMFHWYRCYKHLARKLQGLAAHTMSVIGRYEDNCRATGRPPRCTNCVVKFQKCSQRELPGGQSPCEWCRDHGLMSKSCSQSYNPIPPFRHKPIPNFVPPDLLIFAEDSKEYFPRMSKSNNSSPGTTPRRQLSADPTELPPTTSAQHIEVSAEPGPNYLPPTTSAQANEVAARPRPNDMPSPTRSAREVEVARFLQLFKAVDIRHGPSNGSEVSEAIPSDIVEPSEGLGEDGYVKIDDADVRSDDFEIVNAGSARIGEEDRKEQLLETANRADDLHQKRRRTAKGEFLYTGSGPNSPSRPDHRDQSDASSVGSKRRHSQFSETASADNRDRDSPRSEAVRSDAGLRLSPRSPRVPRLGTSRPGTQRSGSLRFESASTNTEQIKAWRSIVGIPDTGRTGSISSNVSLPGTRSVAQQDVDAGHQHTPRSESVRSETTRSEIARPNAEQINAWRSVVGTPDIEHTRSFSSNASLPDTRSLPQQEVDVGHQRTQRLGTMRSETARSESALPSTEQAEIWRSVVGLTDAGNRPRSQTMRSETARSGTARSGTARSGTARSGTARSGTARSGTARSQIGFTNAEQVNVWRNMMGLSDSGHTSNYLPDTGSAEQRYVDSYFPNFSSANVHRPSTAGSRGLSIRSSINEAPDGGPAVSESPDPNASGYEAGSEGANMLLSTPDPISSSVEPPDQRRSATAGPTHDNDAKVVMEDVHDDGVR
ncbi:hypothetical protein IWX47DRAFT_866597 [Phyllosticta citricarpa]